MEEAKRIGLGRALVIGTFGFTAASLVVYGFWAVAGRVMQRNLGEAGFYAVCAVLFIALGGFLLRPLTRLTLARFVLLFGGAFAAYAVCWCLAWFLMRGGREWAGSFAGSLAFCVVLAATFSAWRCLILITLVLFVTHSAGYFLGGYCYSLLREHAVFSKLAWGLCYGVGMGIGLAYAFYKVQRSSLGKIELANQKAT